MGPTTQLWGGFGRWSPMAPLPATPPARLIAAAPAWDQFVERSGLATALALLVAILAMTTARQHPTRLTEAMAGPQLLLVLIVLGCIGILAYRRDAD